MSKPSKPPKAQGLVAIQFLQRDAPWDRGAIESFAPHVAARLVKSGVACDPKDFDRISAERERAKAKA